MPIIAAMVILGFASGLLVNYLADVLLFRRLIAAPQCAACGRMLGWQDYLWPAKQVGECNHRPRLRVWAVNLSLPLTAVWLWAYPPERLGFWVGWVLLLYFSVVAVIDIEHRLILHPVSLAGAVFAAGVGLWRHGWLETLLGGAAGFGIMLGFYLLGGWFAGWVARLRGQELDEVALGFGDVNLAGILGLLLGWPGVIAGLFLAVILGGLGSMLFLGWMVIRRSYTPFAAIPYGPFLILAAIVLLYR